MNLPFDYTKKQEQLQDVFSLWDTQIASFLPPNLNVLLKQSGCLKRFRGISSALVLLKGIFLYTMSHLSFSMLSTAMHGMELTSVSDTTWRKRFSTLVPFLRLLLSSLLASAVPSPSLPSPLPLPRRVYYVDASIFRQEGKNGTQQRIHVRYSLNENAISELYLTDYHVAESLSHFSLQEGDLVMADAGYGTAKNYAIAQQQKADVMLRFTPNHLPIYTEEGKKIDFTEFLPNQKESSQEGFGYVKVQGEYFPVRFLVAVLPEEETARAREKKRKKGRRNQNKGPVKASTYLYAGYLFLVTSLGIDYDREEVIALYRSRWQIEWLFKRIKGNFKIHTIRAGSEKYAEAMVLVWILLWLIVERQQIQAEYYLVKKRKKENENVSLWKLSQICFEKIKTIVNLSWSLFLDWKEEEGNRYLVLHKSRRRNQNEYFRRNVLPGLIC